MAMHSPQGAQGLIGEIGQGDEPILFPLATADMNPLACRINIADFERQGFLQAKPHGVGGEKEHPEAQFAGSGNQHLHLRRCENVRQGFDFGRLDNVDPLPVLLEHVFPEKLQAVAVDLDRTPGMGVDQRTEVDFQLLRREPVGAAVEMIRNPAHGAGININRLVGFALQFQQAQMAPVQFIETSLFGGRLMSTKMSPVF